MLRWMEISFGLAAGTMKDVEIVNLAATASSVTPKTFNFSGSSGIETINVGVGNAPVLFRAFLILA